MRDLERRRGFVEHRLADLGGLIRGSASPPDELAAAIARMRDLYFGEIELTRSQAFRCMLTDEPCSLTVAEWFERATTGVDAVIAVNHVASRQANREIERMRSRQRLAFAGTAAAGALAFALIAVAGAFVRRRVIGRLEQLRDAALTVASGALERPVVLSGADELGAAASAVEQMRTTLHRQNAEQRELIARLTDTQAQLIQQERLASIGQLAGGVAHEINNPLAVLLGNSAHLVEVLEDAGQSAPFDRRETLDALREMQRAAERTRDIVRGLRDFAGSGAADERGIDDLDRAVGDLLSTLAAGIPSGVRVAHSLAAPVSVAMGRSELAQVLQRLLDNAREACGGTGTISVATVIDGTSVVLTIADDGRGIPPELLPKVTEPFFTTKPVGAGTGLGLAVCVGLVRAAGGTLTIDSAPGKGTTVTVTLPIVTASRG
ncbi:MAG: HAMP domain-containing histidine kinase [Deltaproteobacteria bacterium]|nr:HAMP domain-containing histidine kinase [Deltaproteobacteria bacterium]